MRSLRLLSLILLPALGLAAPAAKPKAAAKAPRFERQMTPYAPPVIPHPVEKGAACTACHDADGSGGPALPHRMIPNCQACHVTQVAAKPYRGNGFRSTPEAPGPNRSGFSGAPPAVPHHTLMREVCTACHGKVPRHGARSPHPDRPNCTQCHLPSGAGQ